MSDSPQDLRQIYARRFRQSAAYRNRVWSVLTRAFFQQWIPDGASVLDLGCGYGEFINNIRAGKKYAMDLNPDAAGHLDQGIRFLQQDCSTSWPLPEQCLDVIFTSNFFEHLPNKECLKATLRQAFFHLKSGGRLIAMGPNIKYLPGSYWDFFDHHTVLTEASLAEAIEISGFLVERVVPRFLPYTLVDAPEYPLILIRLYLVLSWLWWIKGRQFLVIARKSG